MIRLRTFFQDEAPPAIGAIDLAIDQLQEHTRVTKRTIAAVARNSSLRYFERLNGFHGKRFLHGRTDQSRNKPVLRFTAASARALWLALCFVASACAPYVVPEAPPQAQPAFTLKGFKSDDGALLPFMEWHPRGKPKAVVLALHGFGDYSNAFDRMADALAAEGIVTYAYDQRGFGVSPGRGRWHGAARLARDAALAIGALKQQYPDVPVFLLGHSMGGGVAMIAAARYPAMPADGLILVAPAVWSREFMPAAQTGLLEFSAHTLPWYPLTGQGIKIIPTDDLAALRALSRDPKVLRRFRVDQVWGLTNLMDMAAAAAPAIRIPSLYLYGLRDDVIPKRPTAAVLARFHEPILTAAIYDGGFHLLYRSKLSGTLFTDMTYWIERGSGPLPSGADQNWRARLPGP